MRPAGSEKAISDAAERTLASGGSGSTAAGHSERPGPAQKPPGSCSRRQPNSGHPLGAPVPPILPPQDGYLFLDEAKFPASFAADVDAKTAAFMADSQVPWGVGALSGTISEPAWKAKPSWYLVAADDKMIPPPAQRLMSQRAGSTVGRGISYREGRAAP
jgi:hypothetical protein